MTSSG